MNICGKNRQLLVAANRYAQAEKKTTTQQIDNENGILNLE
jgi:hypothetical protein